MEKTGLDILAIGVHPDDVELNCAGTLLKHIDMGHKVGIVDLTRGELGTRGSAQIRLAEADAAAKMLGVQVRENLGMSDGFFMADVDNILKIIRAIRAHRPRIVIANAVKDRHPDHGRAAKLISDACFYAGLVKIQTTQAGEKQEKWRPQVVYHMIQDRIYSPDLVVDVTRYINQKMEVIKCYRSQFYDPGSTEPESPISGKDFLDYILAQGRAYGRLIGAEFGEGFTVERAIGVPDLLSVH